MTFSFSNLSLSGVTAAAGVPVLPPGRYVCKVTDTEVKDTKSGTGKILVVKLRCDKGSIMDNINVHNPNPQAVEIGMEQLKALLVHGGHPDPDNIGQHGVASIRGLSVGVLVGSETYNGNPSAKVKGYFDPESLQPDGTLLAIKAAPAPAIGGYDDDLPF
jgi:hypothetical protein